MLISVGLMIPILENMADCYSIYNFCSSTEFACQEDSHCNEKGSCNIAPRTCQCDDGWTQFFDCTFGKFQIDRWEVMHMPNIHTVFPHIVSAFE